MLPPTYLGYLQSIYVIYTSPVTLHRLSITRYRQHPRLTMSYPLPPSRQPDSKDNIDDALTLVRYNEEIEQNICTI